MACAPLKIAVITSTRADWGLLSPLAKALRASGDKVDIVAANMHFIEQLGATWREIEADGFQIACRIEPGTEAADTAALTLRGVSAALLQLRPDCSVILGDRYEMLAAATACCLQRIPIVHIAGGAVSEGAFDDSFRHAITKLSSLHLAETPEYQRRIVQMGEAPETVVHTGAIGLNGILKAATMPLHELEKSLDFAIRETTILATMHAATLSPVPPEEQMRELIAALESKPELRVVFTYPNNDTDPTPLIAQIEEFARANSRRIKAIPSLGARRYASLLHHVAAVVGNSSSGIVEAPSAGIPTLDIGIRQKGRTAAESVVHCGGSREEIAAGLDTILSPQFREKARTVVNPYFKENTVGLMVEAIHNYPFHERKPKRFCDLP